MEEVTGTFTWDEKSQTMKVEWNDGKIHFYQVPREIFDQLKDSDNEVEFYLAEILDWYPVSHGE